MYIAYRPVPPASWL